MRRNLAALANQTFDVLVIGGGMHGACVAYEAALRGLSVALVEQADFASGTSANSLKVIHGGLRYLQTADLQRMRQSIKERQTLMRIAPHLVHPMPVLVPTYGHGMKGKEAMTMALKMNDVISGDRNFPLKDPQKHIPAGKTLSKTECLQYLPELPTEGLTGAAYFHDAQVYNSEQLVLAFIQSAAQHGAQIANYVRVIDLCREEARVCGAVVEDQLNASDAARFTVKAKTVINASGPWIDQIIAKATGQLAPVHALAKAMNLVTRPLFAPRADSPQPAVGITGRAPGSRLFFIAPWRDRSLVGTWYGPDNEGSRPPAATSDEVIAFLADINQAYPSFNLTPNDVEWVHSGLLPSDGLSAQTGDMKLTKRFQLKSHHAEGFRGLLSVKGVKYTTARDLARRAVDWAFWDQQRSSPPSYSHRESLFGGAIDRFDEHLAIALKTYSQDVPAHTIKQLVYNYGAEYKSVLNYRRFKADTLAAEVRYGLENTMAQTLSDILFRRTELGAAGHPGDQVITACAAVMREVLGWDISRQNAEIEQVQQQFARNQYGQGFERRDEPVAVERSQRIEPAPNLPCPV